MTDHIQSAIAARAQKLGLSAYALAKACQDSPSEDAVRRYLTGRCALNSRYVSALCGVLGLELRPRKRKAVDNG